MYGWERYDVGDMDVMEFRDVEHLASIRAAASKWGRKHNRKFRITTQGMKRGGWLRVERIK